MRVVSLSSTGTLKWAQCRTSSSRICALSHGVRSAICLNSRPQSSKTCAVNRADTRSGNARKCRSKRKKKGKKRKGKRKAKAQKPDISSSDSDEPATIAPVRESAECVLRRYVAQKADASSE